VLVDPSVPRPRGVPLDRMVGAVFAAYAIPGVGERLLARRRAQLGTEAIVRETLRLCCVDAGRVPPEVVAAGLALAREREAMPWADAAFLQAARSLLAVLARPGAYLRVIGSVTAPTLLVHGSGDRLVPIGSGRNLARLRPDWTFEVFEDIGHVPQIEDPERFAATVTAWLEGPGRPTAAGLRPGRLLTAGRRGLPEPTAVVPFVVRHRAGSAEPEVHGQHFATAFSI
jgi:pimeloyl-ACP methyl ester carboxylesterase